MDGEPEGLSDTATNCNLASENVSDINQAKLDSLEKKAVHLRLVLEKDFKAADLKWSLFVAAAFSFRYESCLRPFPPAFMKNGIKDIDELFSVIADVPALDLVLQLLDNLENLSNLSDIIDLLFYVLVRLKDPTLKNIPLEMYDSVLCNTRPSAITSTKPQYIFQICNSTKSTAEAKWKELSRNHHTFYAYHGNRLENFYTIMNFGFQQHFIKNTLFGNGVFLSTDLSVSLTHSHGGFGWGASCIGGHLSCIAMCEVIDAPEGINYQKLVFDEGDGVYGEENSKIPAGEKQILCQYVVTNLDLVRPRYLLVYAKQPAAMRFPITSSYASNGGGLREWLSRNKLFTILMGYGLMLATIGFANNQPMNYYYKMLLKKLDLVYSSVKV